MRRTGSDTYFPSAETRHHSHQFGWLDRFREVRLVAQLKRPPDVLGAGVSRQRHRRDEPAALRLTLPHLSYQLVPVLDRHSDVRYKHIGTPFIQRLKRFCGGGAVPHFGPVNREYQTEQIARVGLVIHHDHAQVTKAIRRRGATLRNLAAASQMIASNIARLLAWPRQRKRHSKGRAMPPSATGGIDSPAV